MFSLKFIFSIFSWKHAPVPPTLQKNSNSTPPDKSKDHCVKNNVHFYNKKWNVS